MNPYEVLGVSETATDEQVRSAYIKLVKKYHPDRYQDSDLKDLANDKLKQVNEAYDTITNMRKNGSASQNTYSGSGKLLILQGKLRPEHSIPMLVQARHPARFLLQFIQESVRKPFCSFKLFFQFFLFPL